MNLLLVIVTFCGMSTFDKHKCVSGLIKCSETSYMGGTQVDSKKLHTCLRDRKW
jgi:hypothetical protein